MVKSDALHRRRSGRQRRRILHHLKEIGLAKRLEQLSLSLLRMERCLLNSDRQRVCRCSPYTWTTSTHKDSLFGSPEIKMERSMDCTSAHHECATCRSYA